MLFIKRAAYLILLISIYFILPLWLIIFFRNIAANFWLAAVISYICFSTGYYFIYLAANTIKDRSGALCLLHEKNVAASKLNMPDDGSAINIGIIEESLNTSFTSAAEAAQRSARVRAIAGRRSLGCMFILWLLFLPFLFYFNKQAEYNIPINLEESTNPFPVTGEIFNKSLEKNSPKDSTTIKTIKYDDIVVVEGVYDRAETVLNVLEIPYKLVTPSQLNKMKSGPEKIIIVNCPGIMGLKALDFIKKFVEKGGWLITTDWSLAHTINEAMPGYIKETGDLTGEEFPTVQIAAETDLLTKQLYPDGGSPSWWCEISSFPILIITPQKVNVLVKSAEFGKKWNGADAVVVSFNYEKGRVIHVLSHFYQRRCAIKSFSKAGNGLSYVIKELKIDETVLNDKIKKELSDLKAAQVESAYSVVKLLANILIEKFRK